MSNSLVFMIVAIVAITTFGRIYRDKHGLGRRNIERGARGMGDAVTQDNAEAIALRHEVIALKERIAVLERITTDSHSTAARIDQEIESLRDQREATTSSLRDR